MMYYVIEGSKKDLIAHELARLLPATILSYVPEPDTINISDKNKCIVINMLGDNNNYSIPNGTFLDIYSLIEECDKQGLYQNPFSYVKLIRRYQEWVK